MRGRLHERLLVRNHVVGKPAVARASELLHPQLGLDPSIPPTREVGAGDAIAGRDASDILANGDDLAGPVAHRYDAWNPSEGIMLVQDQKVSIVERACMDAYDGFVRARLGCRIVPV